MKPGLLSFILHGLAVVCFDPPVKKRTLSVREQRIRRQADCDHLYKAVATLEDSRIVCVHCAHIKAKVLW